MSKYLLLFIAVCVQCSNRDKLAEGIKYLNQSKPTKAIELLQQEHERHPKNGEINYYLGLAYYDVSKYGKAYFHLSQAKYYDYSNIKSNYLMGIMALEKGNCMTPLFLDIIKLDSTYQKAWYYAAYCFAENYKLEDAKEYINKSLSLKPEDHLSYQLRARISYSEHNLDIALNDINKAIEIKDSTYYYYLKAVILDELSRFEESLESSELALKLDSTNTDALYYKAMNLINLNRFEEGCLAIEKVKKLDPDWKTNWDLSGFDKFCE